MVGWASAEARIIVFVKAQSSKYFYLGRELCCSPNLYNAFHKTRSLVLCSKTIALYTDTCFPLFLILCRDSSQLMSSILIRLQIFKLSWLSSYVEYFDSSYVELDIVRSNTWCMHALLYSYKCIKSWEKHCCYTWERDKKLYIKLFKHYWIVSLYFFVPNCV